MEPGNDPSAEGAQQARLDKWLWAVRVFKTRSMAIAACRAGHVKIGGQKAKPARPVRIGETLTVLIGEVTRTLKVTALLERRVGAAIARQYVEDLTPPDEYQKAREKQIAPAPAWPKGLGRPTKKDRRLMDLIMSVHPPDGDS